IEKGLQMDPKSLSARTLFDRLPFELTRDQKKVIREISRDMSSPEPMNRLLQGDVGSGKTIVAALSMLVAVDNGFQTLIIAPTEILAEQHYHSFKNMLKDLDIEIVQLLGGQRAKARRQILESIESGKAKVIIGTHALFESTVHYNMLGLIVIDEQHRFGVAQRAKLKKLAELSYPVSKLTPDVLVMSATPIPRTLSLTVYGDLDVSIIKQMPAGRKPIRTKVVFEKELPEVFEFIRSEIEAGRQAFIVYPLVEKSEKIDLKSAVEHFETIDNEIFHDLKCGLIHGQMFWYEKEEVMQGFLDKEYDVLVATTVIEVGIDVPNASVMLIENSERFGLSQLHQLRGRVGRGDQQSYCLLATKDNFKYQFSKKSKNDDERINAVIRLKTMEESTDGFRIAEVDMELRGPGDVLGTRQSGLPSFRFLDIIRDVDIISSAKNLADEIITDDPHLRKAKNSLLKEEYMRKYSKDSNYFDTA
nr:ATP-dependent DNA helicase RecG [Candidatus Kapabacteria bacterium]